MSRAIYRYLQQLSIPKEWRKSVFDIYLPFFINMSLLIPLSPTFQKRTDDYIQYIEDNHQPMFTLWWDILNKDSSIFSKKYSRDMAENLTNIYETVLLKRKKKSSLYSRRTRVTNVS